MEESREKKLGTAPLGKLIFQLALPGILAQLINVLYNMVDRMYIGHMPETGSASLGGSLKSLWKKCWWLTPVPPSCMLSSGTYPAAD